MEMKELTLEKFEEASEIVEKVTQETKLIFSEYFSSLSGNKVYFKPENMQRTGAYKVRGAYYKISQLSPEESAKGVIACSAGNHAQGGGLTAARGADEDDELLVLNFEVEIGNRRSSSTGVDLVDMLAADRSHNAFSSIDVVSLKGPRLTMSRFIAIIITDYFVI